ncbi:MAG TPA: tetratricopeptide repeat protein [Casimicrobiaceae bacterium]|nr:tetratricopeptide repeat protein [Casimicrobiaceae bacterium]
MTSEELRRRVYRFGDFMVNVDRGELTRNGTSVPLRPKSFHVLCYLLENQRRLVSKDELLNAVWGRMVVTEGSVAQCLIDIRRALGGASQSFVRTVPRRGYIFDVPVSTGTPEVSRAPEKGRPNSEAGNGFATGRVKRVARLVAACVPVVLVFASMSTVDIKTAPRQAVSSTAPNANVPIAYRQARFFYARRGAGDIERSIRLYDDVLKLDPTFAPAWVGLAAAYRIQVAEGSITGEVGRSKRRFAVEQALRIDPHFGGAHIEAAKLAWDSGDDQGANDHARKALDRGSQDPIVLEYLSNIAAWSGRLDEAIELARRVVALDPLAAIARNQLANLLLAAGRFDEAKEEFEKQSDLNPSAAEETRIAEGFILILEHRFDEAFATIDRLPPGEDRNEALAMIGRALGRNAEAEAALHALSTANLENGVRQAEVHAFRGEFDEAFRALERVHASTARDNWSSPDSVWIWQLNFSPFLRPLRADPRWARLKSATAAAVSAR